MVMSPAVRPAIATSTSPLATGALVLPSSRLFGTDGIRGRVGDLLDAPLALHVGFWAGRAFRETAGVGAIALGQDSRNSSSMLAMALSAGLTAAGLEVWDLGLCPTPCVAHQAAFGEAIGGVMVSASHNPPGDNGIKFFNGDGTKLSGAMQERVEAGLRGQIEWDAVEGAWGKHYARPELVGDYLSALQTPFLGDRDFRGTRVVLDLAWGAASQIAPQAFAALGAEVVCLHDRPDGNRINVNCGSTHLDPLKAAVLEQDATLGFAFDGDADRVLAVDGRGRAIDGDYILYLWGQALRQTGQLPDSSIVSTVMANLGFERAWQAQGGRLLRTSVGDRYVHAEMQRTGSTLGGEQSGHIICSHYGVSGDGLQTALHLAALVQRSGTTLADSVDNSFTTYPQLLRNVRVEDRDRRLNWRSCDAVQQAIDTAEAAMGDRGRVLVRASGTEPVIRVMVEAAAADLADYWTNHLVLAVQQHLAA